MKNWHINAINADKAWDIMTNPVSGEIDYGDVRIAHIDTGITKHPVFAPWTGEANNLILDQWTNFIETDRREPFDPLDYGGFAGHGTRIGSVMYGNLPGKMRGIAPDCPVVPYRATNSVILARVANKHYDKIGPAIRHAVDNTNCSVVSMSLGTPMAPAKNMGSAIDHAYDSGVIVVAASGNNVSDHVTYPGKYFRTICAGGISPNREIWKIHNKSFRNLIDIFAPADEIFRGNSYLGGDASLQIDYGENGDGTSYATACTAGAAALWLAHRAEEIENTYNDHLWMRTEAFRSLLRSTAAPLAKKRANVTSGILDIEALLIAPLPAPDTLKYEARKAINQFA